MIDWSGRICDKRSRKARARTRSIKMPRENSPRVSPQAAAAAADWFARLQEEDATDRDFQQWRDWLAADPEHNRAYREMEHAWRLIGEVGPSPLTLQDAPTSA